MNEHTKGTFDPIHHRQGKIGISREMILNMSENELRVLFSNFFPFASKVDHDEGFYQFIVFYGVSPFFFEIEEGSIIPEYEIIFKKVNEGTTIDFRKKK